MDNIENGVSQKSLEKDSAFSAERRFHPPSWVSAKPKITEGLKDQSVVTGTDATFSVKYAGSPKPEAKWLKDDAEIQIDGKHYRVSEAEAQFTLVIKECKDDDKGRYKCVVENKFGKDESSAELKVLGEYTEWLHASVLIGPISEVVEKRFTNAQCCSSTIILVSAFDSSREFRNAHLGSSTIRCTFEHNKMLLASLAPLIAPVFLTANPSSTAEVTSSGLKIAPHFSDSFFLLLFFIASRVRFPSVCCGVLHVLVS